MTKVFLCHSSKNKKFVKKLAKDLRKQGVEVWLDEWEMKIGDSLSQKIQEGIKSSSYLAVILSPDSVKSKWVERELNAAFSKELEKQDVFILPILYKKCEIPLFLKDKFYADFTGNYKEGLRLLLQRLQKIDDKSPQLKIERVDDKSPQERLIELQIEEMISKRRIKHYADLNKYIFKPLSSLEASVKQSTVVINGGTLWYWLKLTYNVESVRNSPLYQDALKHIQKDYPRLKDDFESLEEAIKNLNEDIDKLHQNVKQTVGNMLSEVANVTEDSEIPKDSVFLSHVLDILETYWSQILYGHVEAERPLKEVLSGLKPFEKQYPKRIEGDKIWYGNYRLMNVTQDKEAQIISIIEQVRNDNKIIIKLIGLKKEHKKLIKQSKEIANSFKELSIKIDAEKYETVASCCPT